MLETARALGELAKSAVGSHGGRSSCASGTAKNRACSARPNGLKANLAELQAKAVAYINSDVGVNGPKFQRFGHSVTERIWCAM